VVARSASWSLPARSAATERARFAAVVAGALLVFALAWLALQHGFYREEQIRDTPVYQRYGDWIVDGKVPYRDFRPEYPPAALPAFAVPSLAAGTDASEDDYRRWFEALMVVCGAFVLLFAALTLRSLGREPRALAAALLFVALSPLLLGSVVLSRFDLLPAALVAGAVAALCAGRERLAFGVLGLGVAAKVYPAVLAPLFVVRVWARGRLRAAVTASAVLAGVLALCFVPFVVLGPAGVWESVERQVSRPLQLESLGASVLLAAHHAFGLDVTVRSSHGSQNLVGTLPDVLAALQSLATIAILALIWLAFAREPLDRERLVRLSAAAVCTLVALGKVASPQFLLWLVPLVPLVRGRRGLAATGLLGVTLVLTQIWFPYRYWDLVFDLDRVASWTVLGRDLVLLALLGVLVWPARKLDKVERELERLGWRTSDGRPISHRPPYGTGVVVWRRGEAGVELLVLHQSHHGPEYEGDWAWGPAAGARLPGESIEECARRELLEETGLELDVVATACGRAEWPLFAAEAPPEAAVTLSAEHDAWVWLPVDDAAARCLPAHVGDGLRNVARTL
jgi:8-oxo-dGTP pyrophosphatase MutT (NUDIX family)